MVQKKSRAAPAGLKRVHVVYKGRVQGVGFRYTAERIALETGVTGWVRNLPGGDVELMAEGRAEILRDTLERIKQSEVGRHIRRAATEWREYENEFSDFRIEFVL